MACARVVVHMPCMSESTIPTATPLSIGSTTIAIIVQMMSDELPEGSTIDLDEFGNTNDPQRDEQQDAGQRRMRHMGEEPCAEGDQAQDERRRPPSRRFASGLRSRHTMAVRGGLAFTGKAPKSAGQNAAGADPDEVAIDGGRLAGIGDE